jgi:hypothetical protein
MMMMMMMKFAVSTGFRTTDLWPPCQIRTQTWTKFTFIHRLLLCLCMRREVKLVLLYVTFKLANMFNGCIRLCTDNFLH